MLKRPNLRHEISLCTLPDVDRVNSVKLLGVYLNNNNNNSICIAP